MADTFQTHNSVPTRKQINAKTRPRQEDTLKTLVTLPDALCSDSEQMIIIRYILLLYSVIVLKRFASSPTVECVMGKSYTRIS